MKKLFLILIILLILPVTVFAQFLACDIPTETIIASEVEVDGGIVQGMIQISVDGAAMLLLDLTGFPVGRHHFRARVKDASGWWSDWSDPLDAGKPGMLGNVRVVN